jgi:multicomponent Na+:H+ antiporter subunit D
VLISSLLAVIYIWRVVEVAYFEPAPEGEAAGEAPLALLVPTWTLALANLYFGLDTSLNAGVARRAAEMLLGVAP